MSAQRPYSVELGPRGWAQIGTVTRPEFDRIRAELSQVAERVADEPGAGIESRTIRIGELALFCCIDRDRRVLVVDAIARELEAPTRGAARRAE